MKLSEAVREVIRLGDASREYWEREFPKHHPHYPLIRAGEDPAPPPPEDAQIQSLLKTCRDQLYALILLTYLGRGDCSVDDLLPAYQTMKEAFPIKDLAIAQMMAETTLAEYLTDAIKEVQKCHIDLDSLKFANTVGLS